MRSPSTPEESLVNASLERVAQVVRAGVLLGPANIEAPSNQLLIKLADEIDRKEPTKTSLEYAKQKLARPSC